MFANSKHGGRFKSSEYKAWDTHVAATCYKNGMTADFKQLVGRRYNLFIQLAGPDWICKNGNALRKDVDNFIKPVQDSVCRVFMWRDEWCFKIMVEKIDAPKKETKVLFEFTSPGEARSVFS